MTARHFSYSPDTISRWVRALLLAACRGWSRVAVGSNGCANPRRR